MNKRNYLIIGSVIVILTVVLTLFLSLHFRSPEPTGSSNTISPVVEYEYDVNLPNAIMLVDSQGRRTGENPTTGTLYNEITNASYKEQNQSGQLFFSNLPRGLYTLYVLGGATGSYWLETGNTAQQAQTFQGTIQVGSMIAYSVNYDVENPASSTLSLEGTSSSTASITSAPPHNLPPPSVP